MEYREVKVGTAPRAVLSAKVQIGLRPVQRCKSVRAMLCIECIEVGAAPRAALAAAAGRPRVGAWLRRALLMRSAR